MFTDNDLEQFRKKHISPTEIENQLHNFRTGFPFVKLVAAATNGHGIRVPDQDETSALAEAFNERSVNYSVTKMVPASGAASRMFKSLFSYLENPEDELKNDVAEFIERIGDFAFYPTLKLALEEDDHSIEELLAEGNYKTIIRYLLTNIGLDYASLPKGLLQFHKYDTYARTPLEEHMAEGVQYSRDTNDTVHLHFTVSPEHQEKFIALAQTKAKKFTSAHHCSFDSSWSEQKPSTDTIAVDMNNDPFRNADGSILFRPGGHGALIENLDDLDSDIVFIKNIDNVVPDKLKEPTYLYKKVIGGLLIQLMERSFSILDAIDKGELGEDKMPEAFDFAKNELDINFRNDLDELTIEEKRLILSERLNKPMRICGMVRNEGEPGGGPFWVAGESGRDSLQIVESSQIDMSDAEQARIVQEATHFNPVDLVCCLRNFKGEKFNLKEFVDPQTGFISIKSKDGRDLKAQELPGLWNGAMANWITIFVEVPIDTFNPVKTVNDLLRPQHQ